METGLLHFHSFLRWVILILLLTSIVKGFSGWMTGKSFTPADRKVSLFTMISAHIQLVLGLTLYVWRGWYKTIDMGNPITRFWGVEHLVGMLLAIILITIGNGKVKRGSTDKQKFKAMAIFFTIALVIIIATIPWPFREIIGEGRGWF